MPSPEHQAVVELVRASRPPGVVRTLEEDRAALDSLADLMPLDPSVSVDEVDAGGVPAEVLRGPAAGPLADGALLYLHGGAYTQGSPRSHRELCGRLTLATGLPVVVLDYRLAPEHPHPAAVEDALTAHRWLLDAVVEPMRIAFAGDSAGGGLVLAALVAARDRGIPLPGAAVVLSPWADLTLTGDSMTSRAADDPALTRDSLATSARRYAGDTPLDAPLVSPLFADLTGLPPLLVLVGTAEVLLDDSVRLAEAARAAGVDVDLDVEDDLAHVWPMFSGVPEAAQAIERIAAWLAAVRGRAPTSP